MDLSVIIVNYNVRQFLENALISIGRAMEGFDGEVFVVDNASDDGSVEMVKKKFPHVCLTENKINVGFAKANNMALKRASGRYLLLINPDTVVQEDTFRQMITFLDENRDVGLAGCKILNPDGSFQLPCRRSFPTPWVAFTKIFGLAAVFPRSKLFGKYNLTYLNPEETYEVDAVSGSFMMIRREVYEQIGGLDETFFMYGEDLDWCYRVSKAGHKVYYVHSTKIIHFKGESTRRSDLDEVRVFYRAMQLFVEKHFSSSMVVEAFLTLGIVLRASLASLAKLSAPLLLALFDFALLDAALIAAELVYLGGMFRLPHYAYPIVWTVPGLILTGTMFFSGLYTTHRNSVSRAASSVVIAYTILSAIVFFAKDFAFSRGVVLISGAICFFLLPGFRMAVSVFGRSHGARKSLFGRRTIIVGTGQSAQQVLQKLRARIDDGYDVLGFIDLHRRHVGEKIAGVEVIGSLENVGKVIGERRVSEVIFSTDGLSYTDILSVIARSNDRSINFRLVPNSLEAIIGKSHIDELDTLPLVDIEYNIHKAGHRFIKRSFDIVLSVILLILAYPFVRIRKAVSSSHQFGPLTLRILLLPHVFLGRLSFVGRPLDDLPVSTSGGSPKPTENASYLGPQGLTGLSQINELLSVEPEEAERYSVYYAKNQSFRLDLEIILKSFLVWFKNRGSR